MLTRKCLDCNTPLEQYDCRGLDCPACKRFYSVHALHQLDQEQIAINEAEAFAEWHQEQAFIDCANGVPA